MATSSASALLRCVLSCLNGMFLQAEQRWERETTCTEGWGDPDKKRAWAKRRVAFIDAEIPGLSWLWLIIFPVRKCDTKGKNCKAFDFDDEKVKTTENALAEFDVPLSRGLHWCALKTIYACSNSQARSCSNAATSTSNKGCVAMDVVTPKYSQNTEECVIDNHGKGEHNQTQ
jgi:hypothetical protein